MKLADVPKFDRTLFTKEELTDLQVFADRCIQAEANGTIEKVGAELDQRRIDHRGTMKELGAQSRAINALYKRLIQFVPRPMLHEEAKK